jgi:hypothetical protein
MNEATKEKKSIPSESVSLRCFAGKLEMKCTQNIAITFFIKNVFVVKCKLELLKWHSQQGDQLFL